MTSSIELLNAIGHASEAASIAGAVGYPLPPEYAHSVALGKAARKIAAEPEPLIPVTLPGPGKLDAFIATCAGARNLWRTRVEVATEVAVRAERAAARIALGEAPGVANHLADALNTRLLPKLITLLDEAPHTIGGHESADELARHAELLRVVGEASRMVQARARLASHTDEGAALGKSGALFLLVEPGPNCTVRSVTDAIASVSNDGLPATLERWRDLRPLGLSIAMVGEAAARADAFYALRANTMRTPDGGQRDHRLGELAAIAGKAGSPVTGYAGPTGTIRTTAHAQSLARGA